MNPVSTLSQDQPREGLGNVWSSHAGRRVQAGIMSLMNDQVQLCLLSLAHETIRESYIELG